MCKVFEDIQNAGVLLDDVELGSKCPLQAIRFAQS